MFKMNKILILGILVFALVTLSGAASADSVADGHLIWTLDSVTSSGHYYGTPVLLSGDVAKYGYNYTFVPDGMYTVKYHVTNDALVPIDGYTYVFSPLAAPNSIQQDFTIPAGGSANFSLTLPAPDSEHIACEVSNFYDEIGTYLFYYGDPLDIVNQGDSTEHTVDEGPMSNAIVTYLNGKPTYTGSPLYAIGLGL